MQLDPRQDSFLAAIDSEGCCLHGGLPHQIGCMHVSKSMPRTGHHLPYGWLNALDGDQRLQGSWWGRQHP